MKRTPVERDRIETLRADRMKISGNRCEFCGVRAKLDYHHIVDTGRKRRLESELFGVACGRMVCYNCHMAKNEGAMKLKYRKEFQHYLRDSGKTDKEIREITGMKIYI